MKTTLFALFCLAVAACSLCHRAEHKIEQAQRAHFIKCDTDTDCFNKYGY